MFRGYFSTPTTIDTKPLAPKHNMAIDTTARHQGEKLFSTIATSTSPTAITPMTTAANAANTMTMMVSPKVLPTVKSTSVNVNMDDQISSVNNDSVVSFEFDAEPLRSASISLSIELAKKTSYSSLNSPASVNTTATSKPIFMQKPDNITPQSSLPKYITKHAQQQERPSSIASHSSNSLLQRMAHSPKAAPATFSTSVSANGKNNSHQEDYSTESSNNTSAVIESLSKQINPPAPVEDLDELTEEDIHNVATNTTTPTVSVSTTDDEEEMDPQDEPQQKLDSSQSSTCENTLQNPSTAAAQEKGDQKVGGFWSWLGFPPSDIESTVGTIATRGAVATVEKSLGSKGEDAAHQDEQRQLQQDIVETREAVDQNNTTTTTTTTMTASPPTATAELDKSDQRTKTSSWSSFLFSSRPSSIHQQQPQQKPAVPANQTLEASTSLSSTTTNTDTNTQATTATADAATSDANLRKVKSTSSLPSSPLSTTQTLRYSASISSFQQPPKKKNFVFPPFESQFLESDAAETNTISASNASTSTGTQNSSSSNLIIKAMDAINSILVPAPAPPVAEEESTSNWIAKRMRAKFSNFVEDIKHYTSTKDPVQSAMLDKRIVVVGVHGWFPMKVSYDAIY